jgi:hypothetical protein
VFKSKQKQELQAASLQQEVARLRSLDTPHLASEVMARCGPFGPDFEAVTTSALGEQFQPRVGMLRVAAVEELYNLIDEGAQTLMSAGLLAVGGWAGVGEGNAYVVTRAGRAALAAGTVDQALGLAPGIVE